MVKMDLKHRLLQESFGYTEFRSGQEKLIDAMLNGQDVLAIMPTGAGKSICYQIPAVLLPGITLIVTPSISLMQDQVAKLQKTGISACFINSTQTASERQSVLQTISIGRAKLVYIAPERLFLPDFTQLIQHLPVSMIAVDEAHCISQWGHDFRPAYRQIPRFIGSLMHRPVIAAFTATATVQVRQDIIEVLGLHQPEYLVMDFDRPNLYYEVRHAYDREFQLIRFIQKQPKACGIVYCLTRRKTEEIAQFLCDNQIPAAAYHAGLEAAERRSVQQKFLHGIVPVIVATNAFGMGIDKPDVRFVVHLGMPRDLESYYQEAGRAGRDGMPAQCLLLFDESDLGLHENLIRSQLENLSLMPEDAKWLKKNNRLRLKQMKRYVFAETCLRQYILNYFGQDAPNSCGNCGCCNRSTKKIKK